jgi:copper chaperone CopZ
MRISWITMLLGLAAMTIAAASYAAPAKQSAAAKSVTVTVAVTGFSSKARPDDLRRDLATLPGVTIMHVTLAPAQVIARLDEATFTAGQFVTAIAAHPLGTDVHKTYGAALLLYVDTQMCAHQKKMCAACFPEIPKRLKAVKGVQGVNLDATGKIVTITFAKGTRVTTSDLISALKKSVLGFSVSTTAPAK